MNDQNLEEVTTFKYPGATLCKDATCLAKIRIKIASAMAAMAIKRRSNTINFAASSSCTRLYWHLHPPLGLKDMDPAC